MYNHLYREDNEVEHLGTGFDMHGSPVRVYANVSALFVWNIKLCLVSFRIDKELENQSTFVVNSVPLFL